MVNLSLIVAIVFLGIAAFITIRNKEWWLAGFAFVAGVLLAGNKVGVWITTNLNEFAAWVVAFFQ